MSSSQADIFAEDAAARNTLSEAEAAVVRERLEATLARIGAAREFPWSDPLDATHEENRFERDCKKLGAESVALWERFDKEMDRLYATRQ